MSYTQWYLQSNDPGSANKLNKYVTERLFDSTWWSTGAIIAQSPNLYNSDEVKLLNIGRRWGRVIYSLKYKFNNIDVYGVELTKERCECSRKVLSDFHNIDIKNAGFLSLDIPTDYLSHTISIRVIQYLSEEEKRKFMSKLWKSMKIGGEIFISIPNLFCPIRWFTCKHAPLFNGLNLKSLVESDGFKINRVGSYNLFCHQTCDFPMTVL